MVEVYAVKLNSFWCKEQFNHLLTLVSSEKGSRIKRYYRLEDAQRVLAGDILIRYLLSQKLNLSNKDIRFGVNPYGKPFLLLDNEMHFNISHSGNWVVCCIDNQPLGIDVEQIQPIDLKLADRFFAFEEIVSLNHKKESEKINHFYNIWTLKESYIKAVGKGLSIPLNSFSIKFNKKGYITVTSKVDPDDYYFKQYELDRNYKLAVCAKCNEFQDEIQLIEMQNLYEHFIKK
ncbi:4'-phosphopantetheinyl transferase superfamily protein [Paenibacillus sp. LMG 31461]|uniref:4'-phosphopantetheinyl transferase superfamily protein n=1 Tax=Paenibacillus plantarum TaxID=2654975 RepID=A0ABX1X5B4_9BACL|nr:4'-phosphopantetheinyl transferase superfamily protein [Paenibacillus plantarum]NOU63259.1 4'-phosphopantetheinyl transferase superfamily protein [Paenibacillus plantarum]